MRWLGISFFLLSILFPERVAHANAQVIINEIADKGTESDCSGEDWLELFNSGSTEISLAGYTLYDDNGPDDSNAFTFDENASIPPQSYLVLCCNGDGISSPGFKIGGDDTVTLSNASGEVVDSSGMLPDAGTFGATYARSGDGELVQTITPTPGSQNVITAPTTISEKNYEEQNAMGSAFFGMGNQGGSVLDAFDAVIDLHVQVDELEWESLRSHPYAETYIQVNEFKVVSSKGTLVLPSPGRMRPRGQSTLFFPICMNEDAIPFKLDFASINATQTLFGVQTAYLRTHLIDQSHMREWIMHRLLARFGLPYLRTRHVRFHVNGKQLGFYTLMEAADQEYVMSRNFNYTFDKYTSALYKVKTFSIGCGNEDYVNESGETSTGPYAFERGDHREKVMVKSNMDTCFMDFFTRNVEEKQSVIRAFYDSGFETADDCGEFLLDQDLIDRDIGTKNFDTPMKNFINSHLSVNGLCKNDQCTSKSKIRDEVDVDNWLKNFAVYAVVVEQDSPMGFGNNYFLAAAGDSTIDSPKWKLAPYDHNNDAETAAAVLCDPACEKDLTDWSVIRPTCRGLSENQLVGPLLLDPDLHAKYLSFVREFVQDVYMNEGLWDQMKEHSKAIKSAVDSSPDVFTYGTIDTSYLFEWMKKRSDKVLNQLDLWDNGDFPQHASVDSTEACVTTTTEGLGSGLIAAISVGTIAVAGALVAAVVIVMRRRRKLAYDQEEKE